MTSNGGTAADTWDDFDWFIRTYLPRQTIPVLRGFGEVIQTAAGTWLGIKTQEKKANLVAKIESGFRMMRQNNDINMYRQTRQNCERIGVPMRPYQYVPPAPPPTFGGVTAHASSSSSSINMPSGASLPQASRYNPSGPGTNGFTSAGHGASNGYSKASGSGWGSAQAGPNAYAVRGNMSVHTLQDWKASPMWRPLKALTSMEMLPDIRADESSHTRREKKVSFYLPRDVIEQLEGDKANPQSQPHHSIRLFCTSSDYYRPPNAPYQAATAHMTNRAMPIEYPTNPDVLIDEYPIPFKERGLRGKAGSAPPLDLNKTSRFAEGLNPGKMRSAVMGHAGPSVGKKKEQAKRFWFQVVFAEVTSKEELLNSLVRINPTSAEESLAQTRRRVEEEDFEVGASMMSLKDPLSYTRIQRPIRSSKCSHTQCFDATWWIESNAQHPQWLCPLCSKELKFDDIIVDGYFLEILQTVPESVDEVVIEANGDWHTEDGKYGIASWLAQNATVPLPSEPQSIAPSPDQSPNSPGNKGKRKAIEILSSDDEDDAPLSRARVSASYHNPVPPPPTPPTISTRAPSQPLAGGVIDLTMESSDEGDADEEATHFHQPGADYTSRAADDSTVFPPLEETAARRNTFGDFRPYEGDTWENGPSRKRARASDWMDGTEYVGLDPSGYTFDTHHPAQETSRWQDDTSGWRMIPGYATLHFGLPNGQMPPRPTPFGSLRSNNSSSKSFDLLTSPVSPAYSAGPHRPFYGWNAFSSPSSWDYPRTPFNHTGSSSTPSRRDVPRHVPHKAQTWHDSTMGMERSSWSGGQAGRSE